MSANSEKMLTLRFLYCLIVLSMCLVIISTLSLHFSSDFFLPRPILKIVVVNSTSGYWKSSAISAEVETFLLPSETTPRQEVKSLVVVSEASSSMSSSGIRGPDDKRCDANNARLKVYMYDLPPEFHFGLLGWNGSGNNSCWPDVSKPSEVPRYPGGLNLQHSVEYWLTLDLLSSNVPSIARPCTAVRVWNSSEANVVFVPFFSSLSYNRHSRVHRRENFNINRALQDKVVQFLQSRDEWKRFGGRDHLVLAHHPNSMLVARKKLRSAMFVLSDFGRYPVQIANVAKDVITPYKHMVKTIDALSSPGFAERPILVYFQGAIHRKAGGAIRERLYNLLKGEKGVHFTFGSVRANGVSSAARGMASSKFCLNIAGDTPSSNRLFDAIASHCVPVIISDAIELPYEDVLDYTNFCVFVRASDSTRKGHLLNLLRGITEEKWTEMWERLKELTKHFEYQYPSRPNDAVNMIWQVVARKVSSIRTQAPREYRYLRSQLFLKNRRK
nr:probable arabinosyltransferase ARAD1 [Ipomoea batatas]